MKIAPVNLTRKPPLFFDYLNHFEKVQSFYRWKPYTMAALPEIILERAQHTYPRKQLAEILLRQNRFWEAPPESLRNVEQLADDHTFCVVTGQQAGVLGGPLYTIYKIITVVKLAATLQEEFPEYNFIPLFWLEINDNDFKEINHIQYITRENQIRRLEISENPADSLKPIAFRKPDPQILQWRETIVEDFFDTEFKEDALRLFLEPYESSASYGDAFARLILSLLGRHGLVVINPVDRDVAALSQPIFHTALTSAREIVERFEERNHQIKGAGYPTQIQLRSSQTLLFQINEQQQRVRIDVDPGGGYRMVYPDKRRAIDSAELLHLCETHPEQFSPNVALRPIVQDSLLPTVAYVAGPSETAYFAQLGALYPFFEVPMPLIYPRHRMTIVENKIRRVTEKLQLDYETILNSRGDFIETFIRQHAGQEVYRMLEEVDRQIGQALENLEPLLIKYDPTLVQSLQKTRQSIEGNFRKLSGKITRSLESKNETLVNQLERVMRHLLPQHTYQERVLNLLYFCIKYGCDFFDELLANLPEDTRRHYMVEL